MMLGRRSGRAAFAMVAMLAILLGPATAEAHAEGRADVPDCRPVEVPVALDAAGGQNARLVGQVCYPTTHVDSLRGAVQVLVSGSAYGRPYWDFPYRPETYSYVRTATDAGFTTFNFDRIGIGRSTRPLDPQVSIPSNAYTIHQAISRLRSGAVDGVRYDRVVIAGHSLGSLIAWYEAGTYHDVDAVIASGILHSFNGPRVAKFLTTLYPAALDPRFRGRIVDPGYLTTQPGTREDTFYYAPNADPRVVDTDEATKETITVAEAEGVFQQEFPGLLRPVREPACAQLTALCDGVGSSALYGVTRQITVPVLTVVGQYDGLLCGGSTGANACTDVAAVRRHESDYYSGVARRCLTVAELPNSGHDVNLQRNARSWFGLANTWSRFTMERADDGADRSCWSADGQHDLLFPS
jgi:pimeloyl-ACP methyl ester carboxylesterase